MHHATVADNEDPDRLGCVRVNIPGVITGAKEGRSADEVTEALPWAYPIFPPGGGSGNNQSFRVPNVGARVAVGFDEEDPYTIWYMGSLVSEPIRSVEMTDEDLSLIHI